jgi:hypothetical protein
MYPHLTNVDGEWLITQLDKWTPTKNLYLPLRYKKLQALDDLIKKHVGDLAHQKECILLGKPQHAFRSPYTPGPNTKPVYYVNYAKAIISVRLAFSYHNWYDCLPEGTLLTKFCNSPGCYQPDHYTFGSKPRKDLVELEQIVEITPDLEEWTELVATTIPALVKEAKEAGDKDDKIIADVTRIAEGQWSRPIPPNESSIESIVKSIVHPTRVTETHVTTDEILGWLNRKE